MKLDGKRIRNPFQPGERVLQHGPDALLSCCICNTTQYGQWYVCTFTYNLECEKCARRTGEFKKGTYPFVRCDLALLAIRGQDEHWHVKIDRFEKVER